MFSCYPVERALHPIALYGHTSNGIPGLEITGLGQKGRAIKEKIIFITKKCQYRAPLKRYILCVDVDRAPRDGQELSWCELPLLVLYWSLAGVIPRFDPNDAMLAGQLTPHGVILIKALWPMREALSESTYHQYRSMPRFLISAEEYRQCQQSSGGEADILAIPLEEVLPAHRQLTFISDKIVDDIKITIGYRPIGGAL
jgi:hypothetical protein